MKKALIAALVLPVLAFTCNKENGSGYLEGKVLRISCASFVVQVTNDESVGQDGWKDMTSNNTSYDNVFAASNKCKVPSNIKAGDAIRFKIDKPTPNDCVICMLFDGPPETKYDLKEVTIIGGKD